MVIANDILIEIRQRLSIKYIGENKMIDKLIVDQMEQELGLDKIQPITLTPSVARQTFQYSERIMRFSILRRIITFLKAIDFNQWLFLYLRTPQICKHMTISQSL